MTDQREWKHLDRFITIYKDFPHGEITKTERPDFIITAHNRVTGIELTEIFCQQSADGASPQAQDSLTQKVASEAGTIWVSNGNAPACVQIFFFPRIELKKREVSEIAHSIVSTLSTIHLPVGKPITLNRKTCKSVGMPLAIRSLSAYVSPTGNIDNNRWVSSSPGYEHICSEDYIQEIIEKKNQKVTEYLRQCDEVWLLMVAEGLRNPTFVTLSDTALTYQYISNFDRLFFLEHVDHIIHRLHIQPNIA